MCKSKNHDAFPIEKIQIDIVKTMIRKAYHAEDLADLQAALNIRVEKEIGDMLVFEIVAFLAGKKINRIHVDVEYPINWWQAFKERWFFNWMLRRWPVKYKRIYINENQYAICPHLPTEQRSVHYEFLCTAEERKKELLDCETA